MLTAGGKRPSLKLYNATSLASVDETWCLANLVLKSVYVTKGRDLILNGQVIDVLLGMDFIRSAGGVNIVTHETDESTYEVSFHRMPDYKFVCDGSVGEATIVFKGKSRNRTKMVQLSQPLVMPLVNDFERVYKDESVCLMVKTSVEDHRAIPEGSKILQTIEMSDFIMKVVLLPNGMKRFVVSVIWADGKPPEAKRFPADFGLDRLTDEQRLKFYEELEKWKEMGVIVQTDPKLLYLNVPLKAVVQEHKLTTPVRPVMVNIH